MDKAAMFDISYGLYILTAAEGGFDNGCVTNTLIQVTSSPNRVAIAVNKANKTHDMVYASEKFNISMLTEKCAFDVIERFGFQSGRDGDKFVGFDSCARADNGILYVTDFVCSYLSCDVISKTDMGTHTLFIADVKDGKKLSDDAPLTYRYYQENLKPKKESASSKAYYRCTVCGYIYEGDELPEDFVCPLCKHGAEDFERVEN